nr:putative ribonuclease H-like domain-containing protein [Tanacetum cinerariifolium]
DESKLNDPQSAPIFVQTSEHANLSGHSVLPVDLPILNATPNPTSSKTIGNISYLSDFQELNGGYVVFEDFKLPDESQVLLGVPRENNMYNVNLKDIVPSGDLTCLFVKATIDESNLWHRRLRHVNFKTINKLVKRNIVRGLPTKVFENQNTCVACMKGKQHRASKPLLKDPDGEDVDVHIYRSMIGSLMYLTSLRPDIMFADSPFDLVAYSDSDYAGASLDRKSTTGGYQFLGSRLIS